MNRDAAAAIATGVAVLGLAALSSRSRFPVAVRTSAQQRPPAPSAAPSAPAKLDPAAAVRAARRMNRAAGLIATSVLADSAIEHYRGLFHNKAMLTPLVTASLSLLVSAHGNADARPQVHRIRDAVYSGAAVAGLAGLGFHVYNVGKRPGGFSWENLDAAPLGAPLALLLSGLMGYLSERVRDTTPGEAPVIGGLSAGRVVAAATSAGLMGTAAEAALLHFRGAFHDPFMYLPVTAPPAAAALIGAAAIGRASKPRPITRFWLRLTALLGFAGVGFHAMGVARNMGGWRNWSQNVLNGPPIPAPPSFTGLALAGLAALGLMQDHPDD